MKLNYKYISNLQELRVLRVIVHMSQDIHLLWSGEETQPFIKFVFTTISENQVSEVIDI